jgi:hypothetical protein
MTMEDPTKKLRIGIEDAFDRRSEAAMRAQSHRLGLMSVQQHQLERPTVDPAEVAFTSSLGIPTRVTAEFLHDTVLTLYHRLCTKINTALAGQEYVLPASSDLPVSHDES